MKISNLLAEASGSIIINKGRSLLTILGVVIGIAAVSAIVGMGDGVDAKIDAEIIKLGSMNLTIESRNAPTAEELSEKQNSVHKGPEGAPENQNLSPAIVKPTLTQTDLEKITSLGDKQVSNISPLVRSTEKVETEKGTASVTIQGVSESYATLRNYEVASGSFFTKEDVDKKAEVVVLGRQMASDIFGTSDPIGQSVSIKNNKFTVSGVLADVESGKLDSPNITVYTPYSTVIAQDNLDAKYGTIIVSAVDENAIDETKKSIESILLANHSFSNIEEADFTVKSSAELLGSFTSLTDLFRKVLTGSAAISLLVGGIGIMNIMLVSVTERTREIGLRKAVGAKTRHILTQFLTEAVALTMLGGAIGVVVGQLLAFGMIKALGLDITPVITVQTISLAVGISVSIGIIFGIYPAMSAAKLDPIDALRYE